VQKILIFTKKSTADQLTDLLLKKGITKPILFLTEEQRVITIEIDESWTDAEIEELKAAMKSLHQDKEFRKIKNKEAVEG